MIPVPARCGRCHGQFALFTVVEQATGTCPHCRQPLAPGAAAALLEWALVVDAALGRLTAAVRRLGELDGYLAVDWPSVVQSLTDELSGEPSAMTGAGDPTANRRAGLRPGLP
jgi:hypothetical protein